MTRTRIIKVDELQPQEAVLKEAGDTISGGGLVIIPTETVYGIAADMGNKKTLERLYEIKGRPKDKPFSLHVSSIEEVVAIAKEVPTRAYKLMQDYWPGALTLVLKGKETETIGVRMPDHQVALGVIRSAGVPVACPSANLSGKPAPRDISEAMKDMEGKVELALDAGPAKLGKESTVVDITSGCCLRIMREGAITKEDIERSVNKKTVLFVCTGNSCRSVMAKALLEKKMKELKRIDVEILSAGMMTGGMGATEETRELLKQEGMDVSTHRSRRVTRDMLDRSDIILVMEKLHEQRLLQLAPEVKNRLFLLKEFAKINNVNMDIEDPIGKPIEFYQKTLDIISEAVERVAQII